MNSPAEVPPAPATVPHSGEHRWLPRILLWLVLLVVVVALGQGDFRPTDLERALAPHRYSIAGWELGNVPDKWVYSLGRLLPWRDEPGEPTGAEAVQEFFELGLEQRRLESQLRQAEIGQRGPGGGASLPPAAGASHLRQAIADNQARRRELLPRVEHTVETALAQILQEQGLGMEWYGVFPPVDVVFGSTPNLLALSPRDRIFRQDAILLQHGLADSVKERLEQVALDSEDLSAVVVPTGGLAVYPSAVSDTVGMRYGLEVAAHEWVHQWLFFRPLGRNYFTSSQMLTLNETAATIAGEELGDLVYTRLTGMEVTRPWESAGPAGFDFSAEMRQTRVKAEELLAQGDITGAEAYMEKRRQMLVSRGYNIRKLNQAYFAFHGSYATRHGSVSPIGQQLRDLRAQSGSVGQFLHTVSQFGTFGQYQRFLEARGL